MVTIPVRCSIQSTRDWLVFGVDVTVHPARRRAPDPSTVDVVEPTVAGTKVELLLGKPPHGTPEVRAGVAEDVELAHDLLALGFRKTLALLIQDGRALRLPYHVAVRPLPALLLDRSLPREPDCVIQLILHFRLPGVRKFLLYSPLPVDLLQGELDFEVRRLLRRDLRDRTDFLPAGPHVRLAEHVGFDDRAEDERGGGYGQYGPDYSSHHAEAEEVAA